MGKRCHGEESSRVIGGVEQLENEPVPVSTPLKPSGRTGSSR